MGPVIVAILILLELTLQSGFLILSSCRDARRNPYFIGINSAIEVSFVELVVSPPSQSLFYWN